MHLCLKSFSPSGNLVLFPINGQSLKKTKSRYKQRLEVTLIFAKVSRSTISKVRVKCLILQLTGGIKPYKTLQISPVLKTYFYKVMFGTKLWEKTLINKTL